MTKPAPIGLVRLEGIHYYVHDLERSRRFYTGKLDFAETWRSSPELEREGRQQSACFSAGNIDVLCSSPLISPGEPSRARRFLSKHPDGVGTLIFEVEDAVRAFALLEERGATPIQDVQTFTDDGGTLRQFSITTPFGDCTFRFRERRGYRGLFPGAVPHQGGGKNRFGFQEIDHVTSNFQTMKPMLLWLEHVLGFEQMWEVAFHTSDVDPKRRTGSGLKSIVMWDPGSNTKFANNEPSRPFFKSSQINIFNEELRGDGVQHVALTVGDILEAVRGLRAGGVTFMPTVGSYYDMLPERIENSGIKTIDEDLATLRELEILVDGDHHHAYMLQIFLKEAAGLYGDATAGPFFYEIIQRKGDRGFGAGNFRALFESIEREQQKEGLMLDRICAGDVAKKHHIQLRGPGGELRYEECFTRDGFDGPYTILYHLRRPHTQRLAPATHGWFPPVATDARALAKRHYRSTELTRQPGPQIDTRAALLFNDDVIAGVAFPTAEDPVYIADGDADQLIYVHRGGGLVRSVLGDLAFAQGDYVYIPRGLIHRFVPDATAQHWLWLSLSGGVHVPKQWRNEVGQLRMDAPYSHRDFKRTEFRGPLDEGIRELVVRRGGAWHGFALADSPLDAVGWDGTVYPWAFPILAFQPRVSSVHLPPTWHGTFAARGALICSFVPRPVDFHPEAIPCPYPHSSTHCDEIIFYCDGNFTSRRGVGPGSISHHPMGLPHGPHPGSYEKSIGTTRTDELAVMLDTYLPLRATPAALGVEDAGYQDSFL